MKRYRTPIRTRTDAAGNFLLRDVPVQGTTLVFVLDARPANAPGLEYPVFEMLMEEVVAGRPNGQPDVGRL